MGMAIEHARHQVEPARIYAQDVGLDRRGHLTDEALDDQDVQGPGEATLRPEHHRAVQYEVGRVSHDAPCEGPYIGRSPLPIEYH